MSSLFSVPLVLIDLVTGPPDRLGNPGPPVEQARTDVSGWLERAASTEDLDNRSQLTAVYTLWLDGEVDLSATSRVEFRGQVYNVDGPPGYQPGGHTVPGYTFASVKRVTG